MTDSSQEPMAHDQEPDRGPTRADLVRWRADAREMTGQTREIPEHERQFIDKYAQAFLDAREMAEPTWADLTRPAPDAPVEFALGVNSDGRLDALVVQTLAASGIVSAVPPPPDPGPLTRSMLVEAMDRALAQRVFHPESEYRPRPAGKMLEMIGRIVDEVEEHHGVVLVLGPAKWAAIMDRATDEEREILEAGKRAGRIVLSEHLPEPETAYRIQVPPIDRTRTPWFFR